MGDVFSRIQNHQYDKLHTHSDPPKINQAIERKGVAVDQQVKRQKHSSGYFYFERVSVWLVELLPFCQAQYQVASLPPWRDNEAFTEYPLETVEESANPCPGVEETGYVL